MTSEYYNHIKQLRTKYLKYFSKETQIIDVGCGDGTFIRLLKENNYSVIGIDSDSSCVQQCRNENLSVFKEDAISFLQKNKKQFGGIICSHLIEHFTQDQLNTFIKSCYGALKKNGSMLIITPNINYLGGNANFWNDPTHVRPLTVSSLKKLISKNKFVISNIGYDRDSKLSIRKNLLHFSIDIIRKLLSIIIYGTDGIFIEIFVIAKKSKI